MTSSIIQNIFARNGSTTNYFSNMQFEKPTTVGNIIFFVLIGGVNTPIPTSPQIELYKNFNDGYQSVSIFFQIVTESSSVYSFIVNDVMNVYGFEVNNPSLTNPNCFFVEGTENQTYMNYSLPNIITQSLGFLFFSFIENFDQIEFDGPATQITNFIGNDGYGNKSFGYLLNGNSWGMSVKGISKLPSINPLLTIIII